MKTPSGTMARGKLDPIENRAPVHARLDSDHDQRRGRTKGRSAGRYAASESHLAGVYEKLRNGCTETPECSSSGPAATILAASSPGREGTANARRFDGFVVSAGSTAPCSERQNYRRTY